MVLVALAFAALVMKSRSGAATADRYSTGVAA